MDTNFWLVKKIIKNKEIGNSIIESVEMQNIYVGQKAKFW